MGHRALQPLAWSLITGQFQGRVALGVSLQFTLCADLSARRPIGAHVQRAHSEE